VLDVWHNLQQHVVYYVAASESTALLIRMATRRYTNLSSIVFCALKAIASKLVYVVHVISVFMRLLGCGKLDRVYNKILLSLTVIIVDVV